MTHRLMSAAILIAATAPCFAADLPPDAQPLPVVDSTPAGDLVLAHLIWARNERPLHLHLHSRDGRITAVRALVGDPGTWNDFSYLAPSGRDTQLGLNLMGQPDYDARMGITLRHPAGPLFARWQTDELRLTRTELTGTLLERANTGPTLHDPQEWVLEGRIDSNGHITGSVNGEPLTGRLITGDASRAIAVDFPNRWGPHGNLSAPLGSRPLIDDLAQAQPFWSSEALFGGGRMPWLMHLKGDLWAPVHGGNATPVVGDGRIYLHHQYPNPAIIGERHVRLHTNTRQPLLGDHVVTCLDGATGGILWQRTFPRSGATLNHDKSGGKGNTGAYLRGRYVCMSWSGILRAFDGATGAVVWEHRVGGLANRADATLARILETGRLMGTTDLPDLLGVGNAVVRGGSAFHIDDGSPLWTGKSGTPIRWPDTDSVVYHRVHEGSTLVSCVDALTGADLWEGTIPEPVSDFVIQDGLLIGRKVTESRVPRTTLIAYRLDQGQLEKLWQHDFTEGIDIIAASQAGPVVLTRQGDAAWFVNRLSTADGSVQARVQIPYGRPWQPQPLAAGNRLFFAADSGHAGPFLMFHLTTLEHLGSWDPSHRRHDGGYRGPLGVVVADGRFIIRGTHKLHAYDLRRPE